MHALALLTAESDRSGKARVDVNHDRCVIGSSDDPMPPSRLEPTAGRRKTLRFRLSGTPLVAVGIVVTIGVSIAVTRVPLVDCIENHTNDFAADRSQMLLGCVDLFPSGSA